MWSKNKKEQDSWQRKLEDYEQDMQLLREERDELKAWCDELESRQRQQVFSQQVFHYWEQAIEQLKALQASPPAYLQAFQKTSGDFLARQQLYRDQKKYLLEYIDGFTETYQQEDENREQLQNIQHHSNRIARGGGEIAELSERLRLLSLNVAIESSHSDKQQVSDSLIASLREMSDSSRLLAEEITMLSGRIESGSTLSEAYFATVTKGFIGFSQAIGPLLETADGCSESNTALSAMAGEWAVADRLSALKVSHLLWKFDIYSLLLGLKSTAPETAGLSAGLEACTGANSKSLQHAEKLLTSCQQHGAALLEKTGEKSSKALLARLQKLEIASAQLLDLFDQLLRDVSL